MWPDSSFAVPVSSFVSPVPVPGVDPLTGDCAVIRVNKAWIPYMKGALMQLWLQTTWQGTPEQVTEAQNQAIALVNAINDLEPGGCGQPDFIPPITEMEYQMSICEQLRFHEGRLQGLCCGVWEDIPGQTSTGLPPAGTQPGQGAAQPTPGGGTQRYCGALGADVWLCPAPVNSGDQILFSNLAGAWKDSSDPLVWECPSGWNYALGNCWSRTPRGAPDPLPTGLHMQLVASINGVFYDPLIIDSSGTPTVWTVPGGITNGELIIQANIDDITRVQGEVTFCMDLTNNQLANWTSTLDFQAAPWPAAVVDFGNWVAGVGYEGVVNGGVPNFVQITINVDSCDLSSAQMLYDASAPGGSSQELLFDVNGSPMCSAGSVGTGTMLSYICTAGAPGTTIIIIVVSTGTTGGADALRSVTFTGTGAKPPQLP